MIQAIFTEMTTIITAFFNFLASGFTSAIGMIYSSSSSSPGLTEFGKISLIGVAIGLGYFLFRWIRGLIRVGAR